MKIKRSQRIILISILIIIVLTGFFFLITKNITKYTGFSVFEAKDNFEKCLEEQDITLFINSESSSETLKENPLYDYLDSIKIINCKMNNQICIEKKINGPFPIWIINNKIIEKQISMTELSKSSGCKL